MLGHPWSMVVTDDAAMVSRALGLPAPSRASMTGCGEGAGAVLDLRSRRQNIAYAPPGAYDVAPTRGRRVNRRSVPRGGGRVSR